MVPLLTEAFLILYLDTISPLSERHPWIQGIRNEINAPTLSLLAKSLNHEWPLQQRYPPSPLYDSDILSRVCANPGCRINHLPGIVWIAQDRKDKTFLCSPCDIFFKKNKYHRTIRGPTPQQCANYKSPDPKTLGLRNWRYRPGVPKPTVSAIFYCTQSRQRSRRAAVYGRAIRFAMLRVRVNQKGRRRYIGLPRGIGTIVCPKCFSKIRYRKQSRSK